MHERPASGKENAERIWEFISLMEGGVVVGTEGDDGWADGRREE